MNTLLYSTKKAKDQLNQIIKHVVETQEAVWITKDRTPVVKIVPIERKKRQLGLLANADFWISDDFDKTDDSIISLFYGENT